MFNHSNLLAIVSGIVLPHVIIESTIDVEKPRFKNVLKCKTKISRLQEPVFMD